jgi:hypothetical protein
MQNAVTYKKVWLTDAQAADYLGISRGKLVQLRTDCKITFRRAKDGRSLLYFTGDLDKYVERNYEVCKCVDDMRDFNYKKRLNNS